MYRKFFLIFTLFTFATIGFGNSNDSNISTQIRFPNEISKIKISRLNHFLAYVDNLEKSFWMLNLKTQKTSLIRKKISNHFSFFWAPDGKRIILKDLYKDKNKKQFYSLIYEYNLATSRIKILEKMNYATSYLVFNKMAGDFYFLGRGKIHSRKLVYDNIKKDIDRNQLFPRWFVTEKSIYLYENKKGEFNKIATSGKKIQSFDIYRNHRIITWQDSDENIYVNKVGKETILIDKGRQPSWHSRDKIILYSGSRMLGRKTRNFDLKIYSDKKGAAWITNTSVMNETWPVWKPFSKNILYTFEGSNSLKELSL